MYNRNMINKIFSLCFIVVFMQSGIVWSHENLASAESQVELEVLSEDKYFERRNSELNQTAIHPSLDYPGFLGVEWKKPLIRGTELLDNTTSEIGADHAQVLYGNEGYVLGVSYLLALTSNNFREKLSSLSEAYGAPSFVNQEEAIWHGKETVLKISMGFSNIVVSYVDADFYE